MSLYNDEKSVLNNNSIGEYNRIYFHEPDHKTEEELFALGVNNIFEFKSTDIKMQQLNSIKLKVTLPEIKGKGRVAFLPYASYMMIKSISVSIINPDEKEIEVNVMDSASLLEANLCKRNNTLQYDFGPKEKSLIIRERNHIDDVIFPERDLVIPINGLIPEKFIIAPDTHIIFRIEFLPITHLLSYDEVFVKESLELAHNLKYKNISLLISNTNILRTEKVLPETSNYLIRKKTVVGDDNSETIPSASFKNSYIVSFSSKADVFDMNNTFISIPENDTEEYALIRKWILRILPDLIKITDLDLTKNENKEKLGFDTKAVFEEVTDNTVYFDADRRKFCKIFIENIPEDYKVWYHRNILSFSRNYNRNNVTNISNCFSKIKGICFGEDDCNIEFFFDSIEHEITLGHISIPVNIWNHKNNTEDGDLRSLSSKKRDMFYSTPFILGMDFLSEDKGYNLVNLKTSSVTLNYPIACNKLGKLYELYNVTEYFINSYNNKQVFDTNNNIRNKISCVYADVKNNFTNFITKVQWNTYNPNEPKTLYSKKPIITLHEIMKISYKNGGSYINITPVVSDKDIQ